MRYVFLAFSAVAFCVLFVFCGEGGIFDYTPPEPKIELVGQEISSDSYGDKTISRGKNVSLTLNFKNTGDTIAYEVKVKVTTADSFVLVTSYSNYGSYVSAGSQMNISVNLGVSKACPVDHPFSLAVSIKDSQGKSWDFTIDLKVEATKANPQIEKTEVYSDDSKDGEINRGENIYFRIYVKNAGTTILNGPTLKARENDSNITLSSSEFSVYPYALKYGETSSGNIVFQVSKKCPVNYEFPIFCTISDNYGNSWLDTVTAKVVPINAKLSIAKYEISGDRNADGKLQCGESGNLFFWIQNTGTSNVNGYVYLKLFSTDSSLNISSSSTPHIYYSLNSGEQKEANAFTIARKDSCTADQSVKLRLTMEDTFGNSWIDSLNLPVYANKK